MKFTMEWVQGLGSPERTPHFVQGAGIAREKPLSKCWTKFRVSSYGPSVFSKVPTKVYLVYWDYIGIMEKKKEATIVYWGYRGIMEKKI